MNFGEKITLLRNLKGLSKRQVGDAIGTSDVSIHRYENGVRPKRPEVYEKLARLFGCTVQELTDDSVDLLPKDLQEITEEEKDSQKSTEEKIPVEEKNAPTEQKTSNKKDTKKAKAADDKKAPAKANAEKAEQPAPAEKPKKADKANSVIEKPVEETTEKSAPEEKSSEPAPDKTAPTEFGKRLSALRKAKNLTLAQVADKIGVTLNTYKGMEYKNTRPTDPKVYNKLARVLGCSVAYLKEGDQRFEKTAPVKNTEQKAEIPAKAVSTEKAVPKKAKQKAAPEKAPTTEPLPDLGEIEENIPEEPKDSSSSSSEVIRLVSKLSVLLAGDELSQSEKDAVMASLNGAYWMNKG